jgi:hypothetical protein
MRSAQKTPRACTVLHLHVRMDQQDEGVLQQQHASVAGTLARLPCALGIARYRVGKDQAMECALPCTSKWKVVAQRQTAWQRSTG